MLLSYEEFRNLITSHPQSLPLPDVSQTAQIPAGVQVVTLPRNVFQNSKLYSLKQHMRRNVADARAAWAVA